MQDKEAHNSVGMKKPTHLLKVSEVILMCAGLFIVVSVAVVWQTADFRLWTLAKVFYGVGVVMVVLYT